MGPCQQAGDGYRAYSFDIAVQGNPGTQDR